MVAITMIISACSNKNSGYLPPSSGKPGDMLVVIDKSAWEGNTGTALRDFLYKEFPYLPQIERSFDVFNVPHKAFNGSFVFHRNVIVVNVGKEYDKASVGYFKDKWATPQTVVIINAPDQESATNIIQEEAKIIESTFEQGERDRVISNAKRNEEKPVTQIVQKEFGGSPIFPKGFTIKKMSPTFAWISYETTYVNQGIFVYKYPYNGITPTLESIITMRNDVLKSNVPGMRENSYMVTSRLVKPGIEYIKYQDRNFIEVRGLWELENDFMGGPFISHTFFDKGGNNIIVVEGFVYAPKFNKRNYLRHVEAVVYSFNFNNSAN